MAARAARVRPAPSTDAGCRKGRFSRSCWRSGRARRPRGAGRSGRSSRQGTPTRARTPAGRHGGRGLTGHVIRGSITTSFHNEAVMQQQPDQLSTVFGALADPTRRAILARLTDGDLTVAELDRAVHGVAAGRLAAPQGARGGRAHLAQPSGDRPAQPPRGRAAPRRDRPGWRATRRFWDESYERLDALLATLQAIDRRDRPPDGGREGDTDDQDDHHAPSPGCRSSTSAASSPRRATSSSAPIPIPSCSSQWLGPRRLPMIVDHYEVRDGGGWRYVHREAGRHRVRVPRRLPRHAVARRDRPDLRVRGRSGPRLARPTHPRGARRPDAAPGPLDVTSRSQARDAMVAAGMEQRPRRGLRAAGQAPRQPDAPVG